jgi:dihydrolipoamide dehydrogenase
MPGKYDLVVIGAGPGGYAAAIRGAQLGLKVACVERERPGGICLNWGCIPTKALLKSAYAMRLVQHAEEFGVTIEGKVGFNWDKIIGRSRATADKMARGIESLFKKYKVDHIPGTASFKGRGKLDVVTAKGEKDTLEAKNIIVATGARAKWFPGLEPDGDRIITYREAMVLPELPKSVVVIGAGAIGVEFADFWNAFGAEVTIVEAMPRLVPIEDEEISETLARAFKKKKIAVKTGAKVASLKVDDAKKKVTTTLTTADGGTETIVTDRVLVAVGVRANIEGFGLEGMGVAIEGGFIKVNDDYQTTSPGIYAIGDCAGAPLLAHVATAEAISCVEKIAGHHPKGVDYDAIPGCTYCEPEIASIGKTEAQARAAGIDITVGKFPFIASGKAVGSGHTDGYIKVITNKDRGQIVGVHAIGTGVTDLIAEMSLAMTSEATAHDILKAVHPHPTLSEAMMEATAAALGETIHI